MLKYLFISLFFHLIILVAIYQSVNLFSSVEKEGYYRRIYIKGMEFYSVSKKKKTDKAVKEELKKVIKKNNSGSSYARKLDSKVKEREVVMKSNPTENKNKNKNGMETGGIKKTEQEDREVFKETSEDVVYETDVEKRDKGGKEDYSLIYTSQNLEIIRKIIADSIEYPIVARKMGWEGTVVVGFTLSKDGDLLSVEIIKSSGYSLLDEYTVSVIKEVYKRFPLPESDVRIKIPVSYHLE